MPHAMPPRDNQAEQDELEINKLLNQEDTDVLEFLNRPLDPGEKANDAIDYEDIDDDDLAEDEDGEVMVVVEATRNGHENHNLGGLDDFMQEEALLEFKNNNLAEEDGFDDLFGDLPSSPQGHQDVIDGTQQSIQTDDVGMSFDHGDDEQVPSSSTNSEVVSVSQSTTGPLSSSQSLFRTVDFGHKEIQRDAREKEQQQLFALSSMTVPPPPPENKEELLTSLWPKFKRNTVPRFMDLLPPKRAHYLGKRPLKIPRAVQPTKINLELSHDQEKSFKITAPFSSRRTIEDEVEQKGLVLVSTAESEEDSHDEIDMDVHISDNEDIVDGVKWHDLEVLCEDWEAGSLKDSSEAADVDMVLAQGQSLFAGQHEKWDAEIDGPSTKRQKIAHIDSNLLSIPQYAFPSLEDPERTTSKLARSVALDLNDPRLLIDILLPETMRSRKAGGDFRRGISGNLTKGLSQRYNISNDEAYDLLKENHQSKVRSTLGNLTIEHSMPALRLQFPYYKLKLSKQDARSFHRPSIRFHPYNIPITFSKPRSQKRKLLKGKEAQSIFETAKDLSLGDNSNVLLLEYSEEYPTMMSNFGMGSRLINYYRRKNLEDNARPRGDIGETSVLLPQDKSPFSIFGNIDPGDTMPALYNGMYRAPLFKQQAKSTDFLVVRNKTGVDGPSWYMRNIENLYIVGQEFPLVDVPGPHSRKVTTASKNRLKMISFRKLRRNRPHRINVSEVTKHFPDTTDMQNRQKMKEFMQFSKEHKEWEMRPGEAIPDEAALRAMIKPEDVCLLESMQVGQVHLQDAGYGKEEEEAEEEDGKEGQSMEQQLAPWHTTRNFLHATQGKAMLQLHGEGDPSGRGEAFSFVRTSMKGGFKAIGESAEDKMEARKVKDIGGHSYNVARQQKAYEDSIRRIWEAQKTSLSSTVEHSDTEIDDDHRDEPEDFFGNGRTPRSGAMTPAAFGRRDDETTSQFSRFSASSQSGKSLRISRIIVNKWTLEQEEQLEIVRDPKIIRQYLKRRHALEAESLKLSDLRPTGIAEQDKRAQKRLEEELARLERNKDRRIARDKQKGILPDGAGMSPGSPSSPATTTTKPVGTQRKCANCGQVGHIKTNKKLCPMLNGTMKQEDGFGDSAFGSMGPPVVL